MGLLESGDWARMGADLQDVRDDRAVSITIRREAAVLAAQTVRIARVSPGRISDAGAMEEAHMRVVVLGAAALDIQKGDRFNAEGLLYEVDSVRPNRAAATMAEARLVA